MTDTPNQAAARASAILDRIVAEIDDKRTLSGERSGLRDPLLTLSAPRQTRWEQNMTNPNPTAASPLADRVLVELPIQRATREDLLAGMCGIIRRMTRNCGLHPQTGMVMLCLCDHDERALAIELFSYLEGVKNG